MVGYSPFGNLGCQPQNIPEKGTCGVQGEKGTLFNQQK